MRYGNSYFRKILFPCFIVALLTVCILWNISKQYSQSLKQDFEQIPCDLSSNHHFKYSGKGFLWDKNTQLNCPIPEIDNQKRFTVQLKIQPIHIDAFHVQLSAQPQSADFSIFPKDLGKAGLFTDEVTIQRYPEKIELWINGQKKEEIEAAQTSVEGLFFDTVEDRFWLKTLKVSTSDQTLIQFKAPWFLSGFFLRFLFFLICFCTLLALSFYTFKGSILQLLFTTAVFWAGLLIPISGNVFVTLSTFFFVFLLILISSWKAAKDSLSFQVLVSLLPAAIGGVIAIFKGQEYYGFAASFALTSIVMLYLSVFKSRKTLRGFSIISIAFVVCIVGLLEICLRLSPIESTLRAENLGIAHKHHDWLFYVPTQLFFEDPDQYLGELNFRGGPVPVEKAPKTYRIITAGGSNTWGDGIDLNELTFSGRLESCLREKEKDRKIEVLNMGVPGYASFHIVILLEQFALKYNPDMLILYININETLHGSGPYTFKELWEMRTGNRWDEVQKTYEEIIDDTAKNRHWIIRTQDALGQFRLYNALVKKIIAARQETLMPLSLNLKVNKEFIPLEDYLQNLRRINEMCEKKGITLVLVDEFNIIDDPKKPFAQPDQNIRSAMRHFAKTNSLPYLGLFADFHKRSDKESLVFPYDRVHLNIKGHEEVGKSLCQFIEEENLIEDE